MNKEKSKNWLLPKLRFPEFKDDDEWIGSTIEEISDISSGGTPSRTKPEYWNGDIPWISTSLIEYNKIKTANEFITELGLNNSSTKLFPIGTILMAMYGQGKTRGKVAILDIKAAINQACAAISLKKGMNTEFVFQNLSARYEEIRKISNEGGQKNLSSTLIKKIPFSYPRIESKEQQKIADCLSSLDNLITAETEKLEHLKDHKKGLLQQLFPAKGKTKPQFRFSEFKNDGDWEERMLGKISKITTGRLDANAMVDNGKFRFYTCAKDFYYIDKYAFDTEALLISGNGANVGYIHYYKGKFNAYQRTYVLDDFDKNIIYIKYYLEYNLGNRISIEKKEGNTPYIVKSTLSEMVVFCPKNPKEQEKIANCFSSADDLIQAQKIKIKNLKNHKKGLLQQLFPNSL
jgi:type I restriction enzyme S subunit